MKDRTEEATPSAGKDWDARKCKKIHLRCRVWEMEWKDAGFSLLIDKDLLLKLWETYKTTNWR